MEKKSFGNGKDFMEQLKKQQKNRSGYSYDAMVNDAHNGERIDVSAENIDKNSEFIVNNFDETNIADVRASIEKDDGLASTGGKAYTMAVQPTGPVEVKISDKGRKICADMLLGDCPSVKEFEQKGALKKETVPVQMAKSKNVFDIDIEDNCDLNELENLTPGLKNDSSNKSIIGDEGFIDRLQPFLEEDLEN